MIAISDALKTRLNSDGILESDVRTVFAYCESAPAKVLDRTGQYYTGYKAIGNITLWIQYSMVEEQPVLRDYYFNRTKIGGVLGDILSPTIRISPYLAVFQKENLICIKCDRALEYKRIDYIYLKHHYTAMAFACPVCGQVFAPKEFIGHQAEKIERILEHK
jgi:hypothetical protein